LTVADRPFISIKLKEELG
jgi:hypothetical protein